MEENIYKEIKHIIVYSKWYDNLSDKTDSANLKKKSVNVFILDNLCSGFAKEFNLNTELVVAIAYAKNIAYPTFGEVTYNFLNDKYSFFNKVDYTVKLLKEQFLEPNNLKMTEEFEQGILNSFNTGEKQIKEGRLVYLLEKTIYTAQMNHEHAVKCNEHKKMLEQFWKELCNMNLTDNEIIEKILCVTDTMLENNIIY